MLAWHKLAFPSWFSCVRLLPEPRATKTLIAALVLRSVALLLLLCALLPTVELLVLAFPAHRSSSLCPVCLLLGHKRSFVFLVRFVKCASPHRVKYMRLLTKLFLIELDAVRCHQSMGICSFCSRVDSLRALNTCLRTSWGRCCTVPWSIRARASSAVKIASPVAGIWLHQPAVFMFFNLANRTGLFSLLNLNFALMLSSA